MNQHAPDSNDELEWLGPLLRADADTLRPSLATASQLRWRRETLRRLERRDQHARRAAWPAQAALTAIICATVIAATVAVASMTNATPLDQRTVGWVIGLASFLASASVPITSCFHARLGNTYHGTESTPSL